MRGIARRCGDSQLPGALALGAAGPGGARIGLRAPALSGVTHHREFCPVPSKHRGAHLLRFGTVASPSKAKGSLAPAEPPDEDRDAVESAFASRGVVLALCCGVGTLAGDSTDLPYGTDGLLLAGERRMLFREGFSNSEASMPLMFVSSPENPLLSLLVDPMLG